MSPLDRVGRYRAAGSQANRGKIDLSHSRERVLIVPEHATALSTWESFYVIVGSSGGALIGLQFVVITLIESRQHLADSESVSAFGAPTVVHFAGALMVSAIMSAPWPSLFPASIVLTVCGIGGLVYCSIAVRRARRQKTYEPVL